MEEGYLVFNSPNMIMTEVCRKTAAYVGMSAAKARSKKVSR